MLQCLTRLPGVSWHSEHDGCVWQKDACFTFMVGPQVAVLTGKIESTMPRPQRTALNEARLCNQQFSVSFDLSTMSTGSVSLLHAEPREAGTFVMWSSGHPVRSDPGFGAKMKLPCSMVWGVWVYGKPSDGEAWTWEFGGFSVILLHVVCSPKPLELNSQPPLS